MCLVQQTGGVSSTSFGWRRVMAELKRELMIKSVESVMNDNMLVVLAQLAVES